MNLLEAAVLGLVQGLTEFLPVSSSGHLAIGQALLGHRDENVFFDVVLHVGTLLAVLVYYRSDILGLLRRAFDPAAGPLWKPASWTENEGRRMGLWLFAGTLPTGVVGVLLKERFEAAFSDLHLVGAALFVTAGLLISTRFTRAKAVGGLSFGKALWIGLAQSAAITPGISRSGSTISAAMLLGVRPEEAARFSFLLSVPAILGALVLKLRDVDPGGLSAGTLLIGFGVSALTGYAALWFLIRILGRGGLHAFAPWCVLAGGLAFSLAA